jgi:hypothetical protein
MIRSPFVYLIVSHRNIEQLERLVRRIRRDTRESLILVRHDSSRSALPPDAFAGVRGVRVLPDSSPVLWGRYSMIEMVLAAIRWLAESAVDYRWMALISGQDYPIKNLRTSEQWILERRFDGYLEYQRADEAFSEENERRYFYRYRQLPDVAQRALRLLGRFNPLPQSFQVATGPIGAQIGLRIRSTPFTDSFACYRGPFWWTLSRSCCDYVLDFIDRHPEIAAHYRQTLHPDESFFQTILVNAQRFDLANDCLRYIRWEHPDAPSPTTLTVRDFPNLIASPAHFARKFDIEVDRAVLDLIDHHAEAAAHAPA